MQKIIRYIEQELKSIYPKTEIQGFTRLIIEAVTGWGFSQQILNKNYQFDEVQKEKVKTIIDRLKKQEPIQYILGEIEFYGLKLSVNPSVLIPRPETEELVQFVLDKEIGKNVSILDIGTGSGCIALALKSRLSNSDVSGMDISEAALLVARENALKNKLDVEFFQADILNRETRKWKNYDVIVSNPPYVRESEKQQMHANVLNYEPASALFVHDDDPLIYYKKITEFARTNLNDNGFLFFEINGNLAIEMHNLFNSFEFKNIEIQKDINGKKRMICGTK